MPWCVLERGYLSLAKSLVRRDGLRVPNSDAQYTALRIAALELGPALHAELDPLFTILTPLNEQIRVADARIGAIAQSDPDARLLMSVPSIGPVTATAVVSTVDDVTRFESAHQFEAFLGLVPSEHSSGEKRRLGSITKAGNVRVRYLLVEAAWRLLRSTKPETAALRQWAQARSGVTSVRSTPPNCGGQDREWSRRSIRGSTCEPRVDCRGEWNERDAAYGRP